jgi:hypothetical protein
MITLTCRADHPSKKDATCVVHSVETRTFRSLSPASSVWGQMGLPWREKDYVAFFHQFLGFTNNVGTTWLDLETNFSS